MRPVPLPSILPPLSAKHVHCCPVSPHHWSHTVDEALKLNIEDKDDSSPRRPSTKRARPAEEQQAPAYVPADSAAEGAGRPKRKAAPAPVTETPVKSRGKKAKTDAAVAAPVSKGKKGGAEKKAASGDDEAVKDQQEADEVDALADETAENGAAVPGQGPAYLLSPGHPCVACLADVAPR